MKRHVAGINVTITFFFSLDPTLLLGLTEKTALCKSIFFLLIMFSPYLINRGSYYLLLLLLLLSLTREGPPGDGGGWGEGAWGVPVPWFPSNKSVFSLLL